MDRYKKVLKSNRLRLLILFEVAPSRKFFGIEMPD